MPRKIVVKDKCHDSIFMTLGMTSLLIDISIVSPKGWGYIRSSTGIRSHFSMPATKISTTELPRLPGLVFFAMALMVYVALRLFAFAQTDAGAAAESAFLALWIAAVTAALVALAPRSAPEPGWIVVWCLTAVWIVEYGPHRAALVGVLLTGGTAWTLWRAWHRSWRQVSGLAPGLIVPAAMAVQLIGRSDLLLPPWLDLRTLISLLVLPPVCGFALCLLAEYFDRRQVLLAAVAVAVLAPGWNVAVTLALMALAAGCLVADEERSPIVRWTAGATFLIPVIWAGGWSIALMFAALSLRSRGKLTVVLTVISVALIFVGWRLAPPAMTLDRWAEVLLILPGLGLLAGVDRWRAVHGGALVWLAVAFYDRSVAAAGVALIALAVPVGGTVAVLQGFWGGTLLVWALALGAYPWIRSDPLAVIYDQLGLTNRWLAVAVALGLVAGAAWIYDALAKSRQRAWRYALATVGGLVVVMLVRSMPVTVIMPSEFKPLQLTEEKERWGRTFPATELSSVVVDSNLVHAATLPKSTPVLWIRLHDQQKKIFQSWEVRAGEMTADWAAARRDIASLPGFAAPPAWLSQVAPEGTFFAQRYRTVLQTEKPRQAAWISLRRHPDLPPEVEVFVYDLELRR